MGVRWTRLSEYMARGVILKSGEHVALLAPLPYAEGGGESFSGDDSMTGLL